ncbi:MAG: FxsA family protein [Albidovulum sp.]
MWLLLAFIAIPLIEITLFIKVGGVIGLGWTLAIVLLTAIAGSWLVRMQGAMAMADLRTSLQELRDPREPIAHGAMILLAGALLISPGFFTDTIGILLLLRPVRSAVLRFLSRRITVEQFEFGTPPRREPHRPDIIDGDYTEVDTPTPPERNRPSGWTRH